MNEDELRSRLSEAAILPILTINSLHEGHALMDRLVEAGAQMVEVVFQTEAAAAFLAEARRRHPGCLIGAGTMLNADSVAKAEAAGAAFLVSPGLTPLLAAAAAKASLTLIPGVQTASEVMAARDSGFRLMKYYPAQASNGLEVLADYRFIFPEVAFLATGKIASDIVADYARLPNVIALGGSWMLKSPDGMAFDRTTFMSERAR